MAKFRGKTHVMEYLFKEVEGWRPVSLLKRDCGTLAFLSILQKKLKKLFYTILLLLKV